MGVRVRGWGAWERGGDRWSEGVRLTRCQTDGVISSEEFENKKAELLGRM